MKERQLPEIKIIGEAPSKRDYCHVASNEDVRSILTSLIILEEQYLEDIPFVRREGIKFSHTLLWSRLPDYYKSELADLSGIYS